MLRNNKWTSLLDCIYFDGSEKILNVRTGLLISAFFRIASQMRVCLAHREVDSPSSIRLNRSMKSWCTPISVASTDNNSILRRQGPSWGSSNSTPKPWYLITRSSSWQCNFSKADWWLKTTDRGVCAFFWWVIIVRHCWVKESSIQLAMKTFENPGWPTSWPIAAI